MKEHIKKILSIAVLISLVAPILLTTKVYGNEIMPLYDNITKSNLSTNIDSSGNLKIIYDITSRSDSTSKIVITTYFEQKYLGFFWKRVETGSPNDEWSTTIYSSSYNKTRTFTLPENGTYRTTVVYQVYGTDGTVEEVTHQKEVTY